MNIDHRRSPCIGICSTTYGDLVCRGCRRFAHEIVSWNAYSDAQRQRVWQRLSTLRDAATGSLLEVVEPDRLRDSALQLGVRDAETLLATAYETLRRCGRRVARIDTLGLRARRPGLDEPNALRDAIDAELHLRSVAAYEHSFHVVVDR